MIADTLLLLSLRGRMAWNSFRARSLVQRLLVLLGAGWLALVVGGFAAALGYGAGAFLNEHPDWGLAALIPGAILTLITLMLLFTSFGTELGSLYLTNDLDLLMTAPIDRRAVFISKMLDSVNISYLVLLFTAVPALVTYGLGLHFGPLYYVLVLLTIAATPLLPAGLGALLVMGVARFAPARRVREVLTFAGVLFSMSMALIGNTSRLWLGAVSSSSQNLEQLLRTVQAVAALPIPTMVAGRGLAAAGAGDAAGAVVGLGAFWLLTVGLFAGCVAVADRIYMQGWVRMQSSGSSRRNEGKAARQAAHGGLLGRAPADLAIALKDWRLIPRDLRIFAQMIWPILLIPVFYLNLLGGGGGRRGTVNVIDGATELTGGRFDPSGIFVAFSVLLLTAMIFSSVGAISISMEGRAWWLLKSAPITAGELLRGKYLVIFVPFAILSTVLFVGTAIWRGFSLFGFLYGLLGILGIGAALLALSLGFAVPWAKLEWDDPKRMSSVVGWLLTTVSQAGVGLAAGACLIAPVVVETLHTPWTIPAYLGGLLGAAAVTGGASAAALWLGHSRLSAVGEA